MSSQDIYRVSEWFDTDGGKNPPFKVFWGSQNVRVEWWTNVLIDFNFLQVKQIIETIIHLLAKVSILYFTFTVSFIHWVSDILWPGPSQCCLFVWAGARHSSWWPLSHGPYRGQVHDDGGLPTKVGIQTILYIFSFSQIDDRRADSFQSLVA